MAIEIERVTKRFGSFYALNDVSLRIEDGELLALLGPSGSGKTTLLRLIAGLDSTDTGSIRINGTDASGQPARERGVGFVFQHYALFRHMTVFENIAFGLRVKPRRLRPSEAEIRDRVHRLLALVQLDWLADRYPHQLSGGQRQRIALARALAVEPRMLLLDEPFGALDARVRRDLRRWLRNLHAETKLTTVFVTHDQDEALEVADRIVIMNEGRIAQIGTPEEVYEHPANPFVFDFLGAVNLFHGRVEGETVRVEGQASKANGTKLVYTRPHEIRLTRERIVEGVEVRVRSIRVTGPLVRLELIRLDNGGALDAELPRSEYNLLRPAIDERLYAAPSHIRIYEDDYSI